MPRPPRRPARRRFLRTAMGVAALPTLGSAEENPPLPFRAGHRPWIWEARGKSRIWLAGVLHVASAEEARTYARYHPYFDVSSRLYLETLPGAWETFGARRLLDHRGVLAKSSSLKGVVSPETWDLVETVSRRHPGILEGIPRLRPWLACLEVEKAAYRSAGLRAEAGLEAHLVDLAAAAGKPVGALETPADQIASLAALPRAEEETALAEALRDFAAGSPRLGEVRSAWLTGDLETMRLASRLLPGRERSPLQKALIDGRNAKWAKMIDALASQRDDLLVAVGINHLVAPEVGLPELLRRRGIAVDRVE